MERAFIDAAALGDQAVFLCADINMTEAVSIDEAGLMSGRDTPKKMKPNPHMQASSIGTNDREAEK